MNEVQMNVRLAERLALKVKSDAVRFDKTNEIVLTAILEDFYASWSASERGKFYADKMPYARHSGGTQPKRRTKQ